MGVDYDLTAYPDILNRKIARGTKNFLYEPAMSEAEFDQALETGCELVDRCHSSAWERWVLPTPHLPASGCIFSETSLWMNALGLEQVSTLPDYSISASFCVKPWITSISFEHKVKTQKKHFPISQASKWQEPLVQCFVQQS